MKKFLKITGITLASILVLLYLAILFVVPNVIDLNQFKPDIQKIAKEQANLIIDFENPRISITPLLSAGIVTDKISVKLPDNTDVITADSFKGRISLPSLLLLTVKVTTAEINNPDINVDIVNGKAFKVVQAFEEVLNKKEEKIEETLQTAQKPLIDPASIKIKVPAIKITDYDIKINDLKTKNYLKLRGDELVLGYFHGKSFSIKTIAELFVNETKNISANIDIDTFLPELTKLDKEDDKAQRVEIPFINPVAMYMAYDLKADVNSKIKIRNKKNKIVSKGYFNVDNLTLKLAGLQMPASKLHITGNGTLVNLDTDLYLAENEKLTILGLVNYAVKPKLDLSINSTEIHTENIIILTRAILDSLHIKHELQPLYGEGYFIADTNFKTDFKKLESRGNIIVNNAIVNNAKTKKVLAKVNSLISLDNNMLNIQDTTVEIAETLFKVNGTIDQKSIADINILMEKMPMAKIFTMFLPEEINNVYSVNSGDVNLTAKINGELRKAIGKLTLAINNLDLTDKVNKINYINNLLTIDFDSNFKTYTGKFNNNDFKLTMNGTTVGCEKFNVDITDKDILVAPAVIKINNSTAINVLGEIKDYIKNPKFKFDINGDIITADIKKLLGPDLAIFIKEKGKLPLSIVLDGDKNRQTLEASIIADKNNYLTPIDIVKVQNEKTKLQTTIDFKGDRLKIKDTGFFIERSAQDPKNPEKTIVTLEEVMSIDGTITKLNTLNPNINLLKLKVPNALKSTICAFPQSSLIMDGGMYIFGDLKAPRIRGDFSIKDMTIPELFLSMQSAFAKFESKDLDINVNKLIANGSDFDVIIKADLNPSENFVIKNLNLISNLTDADKLMKVSDAAMKYMPAPAPSTNNSAPSQPADIPVVIQDGTIDIKEIKTGNIILNNTTGNIAMAKNVFYVNNLMTSGFKGKIKGDVSMNLVSGEIKADVKGNGLDVEKTLLDAAAMKDTLTGTMDFDAKLSLKGATYEEQMKTLKGTVNFHMQDGTLGPFGKLENLIMAENIRESAFFQSTIGAVLHSLLSFDTSHYNNLKGHLTFNNGITNINPITSEGDIMGAYIFGDFNLLKNTIDIKLRGRLGSQVSDSLGPLSMLNPVNLVKATPGMSLVLGKMFALFCEEVTETEIAQIPNLGKEISDSNTTKFQVVVRGDVAKPLTLVKSFKWLALQSEIQNANSHVQTLPKNTVPIDFTNTNKEEIKTQAKKQIEQVTSTIVDEETKETVKKTTEAAKKLKGLFSDKEALKNTLKQKALETLTTPTQTQTQE